MVGSSRDNPPPRGRGRVTLRLPRRPDAARAARHGLGDLAGELDRTLMHDLQLLVSELVANSVRHASAAPETPVGLDVCVSAQRVRVEVSDAGEGFTPRERTPGQSAEGGWGLFLVDRLADRWGVKGNGQTLVWLEIDRRSQPG